MADKKSFMDREDDSNPDLEGIKNREYVSLVDRMRARIHPAIDRDELGNTVYPRKDFLQQQANNKKAAAEAEARRKAAAAKKK